MRHKPTPEELIIKELDASNQSTKDMLAVLIQTKELGTDTLQGLNQQGQQIGLVQDNVDTVLFQQEQSKRKLRSISSIFWDFINFFRKDPPVPNHNQEVKEELLKQEAKKRKKTTSCCARKKNVKKTPEVDDVIGDALENDPSKSKYDESEKMLDEAGRIVGDLKEIATEMGKEINTHNIQLDVLKKASDESGAAMVDAEDRIKILLHNSSPR